MHFKYFYSDILNTSVHVQWRSKKCQLRGLVFLPFFLSLLFAFSLYLSFLPLLSFSSPPLFSFQ